MDTNQINRVRQASMVARAAPERDLVTDTPKKLKKAIDSTLTPTAQANCALAAISLKASRASSTGLPSLPFTKLVIGKMMAHSSNPQQPSRPTARRAGTLYFTKNFSSSMNCSAVNI